MATQQTEEELGSEGHPEPERKLPAFLHNVPGTPSSGLTLLSWWRQAA